MQGCRTRKVGVAFVGIACLALAWSQAAQAQVKLEHKYVEGQKLTYKTTSKTHQTLTLMGMEIESSEERSMVTSLATGKRRSGSLRSAKTVEDDQPARRVRLDFPR